MKLYIHPEEVSGECVGCYLHESGMVQMECSKLRNCYQSVYKEYPPEPVEVDIYDHYTWESQRYEDCAKWNCAVAKRIRSRRYM